MRLAVTVELIQFSYMPKIIKGKKQDRRKAMCQKKEKDREEGQPSRKKKERIDSLTVYDT